MATDDLMVFSDAGPGVTSSAFGEVEATMATCGVIKAPEKDVNAFLSAMCVGIDLVDETKWFPPGARLGIT